jgi:hypothetical protein
VGRLALSKARLWANGRRLELVTRAFTSFGARPSSRRCQRRATSRQVVPWSSVSAVDLVPIKPGGDKLRQTTRDQLDIEDIEVDFVSEIPQTIDGKYQFLVQSCRSMSAIRTRNGSSGRRGSSRDRLPVQWY